MGDIFTYYTTGKMAGLRLHNFPIVRVFSSRRDRPEIDGYCDLANCDGYILIEKYYGIRV